MSLEGGYETDMVPLLVDMEVHSWIHIKVSEDLDPGLLYSKCKNYQ